MNRHGTIALVALGLALLAPLTADAGGAITGLDVSPKGPVTAGTTVNITIKGTGGSCDELLLDFGDGTVQPYENAPGDLFNAVVYTFPIPTSHLYCNPGTFQIQAKPKKACVGEGSASLTVQGEGCLAALHKAMEAATTKLQFSIPSALLKPHISALTDGSNITPGGDVGIKGVGFGNEQGTQRVLLADLKKYNGSSTGSPWELKIFKDGWTDTLIVGTIPSDITEVKDQTANLYVNYGVDWSDPYPVNFKATKEVRLLPYTDPAVQLISCGTDSHRDECNDWVDPDDGYPFYLMCINGATFWGTHQSNWGAPWSDNDTDTFQITLKNGWVFDSMQMEEFLNSGASYTGPSGFPVGGTSWQPQVQWHVAPYATYLTYCAHVTIAGSKGVPWK